MLKNSKTLTKVVGVFLIFLTLASTAVVVAKACHSDTVPVASISATIPYVVHTDHHHAPPATEGVASNSLLTDICAGIFYLALLLVGKFLLKSLMTTFHDKTLALRSGLNAYRRRASFNLTLSLPQLGTYRI
jgi:hypothetical protein